MREVLVELLATQTGGATVNNIFEVRFTYTKKSTNFGAVFRVERVVCAKSDGNMKDAHGQG